MKSTTNNLLSAPRWERERAAWVLQRAGRSAAKRRRGELLQARAMKRERVQLGTAESSTTTAITPNLFVRVWRREEGFQGQLGLMGMTLLTTALIVVLAGIGLAVGAVIYGILWLISPVSVKPRSAPFAILGTGFAALAIFWFFTSATGTPGHQISSFMWLTQPAIAFIYVAWRANAYGWAAVKPSDSHEVEFEASKPVNESNEGAEYVGADIADEHLASFFKPRQQAPDNELDDFIAKHIENDFKPPSLNDFDFESLAEKQLQEAADDELEPSEIEGFEHVNNTTKGHKQ